MGYGPTQGAVGKSGKGKDDSKGKGKGYGKDRKGGGDKCKGLAPEMVRGQWELALTVGGFGHYYRHA